MKKILLKILYTFLALCAKIYISRNSIFTIGITGSVWKTSCRTIIYNVLNKYLQQNKDGTTPQALIDMWFDDGITIYTSPKNYNSELWLVFSIFQIDNYVPGIKNLFSLAGQIFVQALFGKKNCDILVLEYGIDKPLDMKFLLKANKPDIAIFTKLDYTHSEFFGSVEAVGDEKFRLMHAAKKKVYLNYSDDYCQEHFDDIKQEKEYYYKSEDVSDYTLVSKYSWAFASFKTKDIQVVTTAIWEPHSHYINLGLRILEDIEYPLDKAPEDIGWGLVDKDSVMNNQKHLFLKLLGQKSRFTMLEGIKRNLLVDSTYNAGPESMKKAIKDAYELRDTLYPDYKIGFVLWDMREIWPDSPRLHTELFEQVKSADFVVAIWPDTSASFWDEAHKFETSRDAWTYLKTYLEKEDTRHVILFKWSQNTIFVEEAIIPCLEYPDHVEKVCRQEEFWKKNKAEFFDGK